MNTAGITHRYEIDIDTPRTYGVSAYHGEAVELVAVLMCGGKPIETPDSATLYWQEEGMGDDWWAVDGEVDGNQISACWEPQMDTGKGVYRLFLSANVNGGKLYRANFALRLLSSPNYVPNELPLPQKEINFSLVQVSNAPWVTNSSFTKYKRDITYEFNDVNRSLGEKASKAYVDTADTALSNRIESVATAQGSTENKVDALEPNVEANTLNLASLETSLVAHENNRANPHGVTAAQVGAPKKDVFDTFANRLVEVDTAAYAHMQDTDNPHDVTAEQVGAIPEDSEEFARVSSILSEASLDGEGRINLGRQLATLIIRQGLSVSNGVVAATSGYFLSTNYRFSGDSSGASGGIFVQGGRLKLNTQKRNATYNEAYTENVLTEQNCIFTDTTDATKKYRLQVTNGVLELVQV